MKHDPLEFFPLVVAATIGGILMVILIDIFDNTNEKIGTYAFLGVLTGIGVQLGVRIGGVS